ncbi:MAG TPA: acyl-CoA dehydrogenase family protein [Trebonia sp.]
MIEAARALSWRACRAVDAGHTAGPELANYAKIFGSETAVRVITDLMRVVGVDSYDDADPLNGLLQDALALPVLAGRRSLRRGRHPHR